MVHTTGSVATRPSARHQRPAASATLVWIDSRQAQVVRWRNGAEKIDRFESDVPVHRHSTGRDSSAPQDEVEGRRLEHLARFVESIAARVAPDDELLVMGPGTVHEQLAQHIQLADRDARRQRLVTCKSAAQLTDGQLVAELRAYVGSPAPRKTDTRRHGFKHPPKEDPDSSAELETLVDDTTDRS